MKKHKSLENWKREWYLRFIDTKIKAETKSKVVVLTKTTF